MIEFSKQLPHRGHVDKIYDWCKKKYGRSNTMVGIQRLSLEREITMMVRSGDIMTR